MSQQYVTKRNGRKQVVDWNKVDARLSMLNSLPTQLTCNSSFVAEKLQEEGMQNGTESRILDERAGKVAAEYGSNNPDYLVLAARIAVSNHQKNTCHCFSETMKSCYTNRKSVGRGTATTHSPRINQKLYKFTQMHMNSINHMVDYSRDFTMTLFGFTTLMDRYLIKRSGVKELVEARPQDYVLERPQDMWMRVACAIHMNRDNLSDTSVLPHIQESYDMLSQGYIMHATPTLYNAGTQCEQFLSCFPAGTKVYTINEGAINIEDVEIGDQVITHMNRIRRVTQLHKNPILNRTVFTIKCWMTPDFSVTDNHKVWSVSQEQLAWGKPAGWNSIDYLRVGDYIALPDYPGAIKSDVIDLWQYQHFTSNVPLQTYNYRLQTINENGVDVEYMIRTTVYAFTSQGVRRHAERDTTKVKRYIKVDAQFAKFLGIWYGDGHLQVQKTEIGGIHYPKNIGIGVTAHEDNMKLIEFVQQFSLEYFGIETKVHVAKTQKCAKLSINCMQIADVFHMLFGRHFDGKIMWDKINDWHLDLIEPFLVGLISTDGCISAEGNVTLCLSNSDLTQQLFHICRRVGIMTSLKKNNPKVGETCPSYRMSFSQENPMVQRIRSNVWKTYTDGRLTRLYNPVPYGPYKIIAGKPYVRIMKKAPDTNFTDTHVYTLGVEEDHSYAIAGIMAQNCFLLAGGDSISEIAKLKGDMMEISKYSGGIGWWWPLRSSGSEVSSTNGTSDGPVPFLRGIEADMKAVNQGGKRPGSAANYEQPTHPDIMNWLRLKRSDEVNNVDQLFYGLWISDEFMRRVEQNQQWYLVDPHEQPLLYTLNGAAYSTEYERIIQENLYKGEPMPARRIMLEICRTQAEAGMPYMLYADACNAKSNQKNIGVIRSSNLCVSGDTPILTKQGWLQIVYMQGMVVDVWNGYEFAPALVQQTASNVKLLRITTSDGASITCTPQHKFVLPDSTRVAAHMLQIGTPLHAPPALPILSGNGVMPNAYEVGHQTGILCRVDAYQHLATPINHARDSKLQWLAGLCDAQASLDNCLHIHGINHELLLNIKLMSQTLGMNPHIYTLSGGYHMQYNEHDTWMLFIVHGLPTRSIGYWRTQEPVPTQAQIHVIGMEDAGYADTYCFGEPTRQSGMFAGIYTGNCAEIVLHTNPQEYACCCISSVCLPKFVVPCACAVVDPVVHVVGCNGTHRVDYEQLATCTGVLVKNLNKIIDINFYPVPETRRSNMRHRPLGIGVQGLSDLFHLLKYPFTGEQAIQENKRVFETIYYGAMRASHELAVQYGPYETFLGDALNNPSNPDQPSPFAQGIFQFDMWNVTPGMWDWAALKLLVMRDGVRNSQLTALPPTASTSNIQGNNECFEPVTSNLYVRKTLSGEHLLINQHLMRDLQQLGLLSMELRNKLIEHRGSVQQLDIPEWMKQQYKTVWEMDNRILVDMDADRAPYIDQTQSSNRFMQDPDAGKLIAMHMRCWKRGLKTGMYYLRTQSKSKATQFSESVKEDVVCALKKVNGVECFTCQ